MKPQCLLPAPFLASCLVFYQLNTPWWGLMGKGIVTLSLLLPDLCSCHPWEDALWRQTFLQCDSAYVTDWTQIFPTSSEFQIPGVPCTATLRFCSSMWDWGSKDQAGTLSGWHSCSECYLDLHCWRHEHAKWPHTCTHGTTQSTIHGYCDSALSYFYAFFCPFLCTGMCCISNLGNTRQG